MITSLDPTALGARAVEISAGAQMQMATLRSDLLEREGVEGAAVETSKSS